MIEDEAFMARAETERAFRVAEEILHRARHDFAIAKAADDAALCEWTAIRFADVDGYPAMERLRAAEARKRLEKLTKRGLRPYRPSR